LKKEKKVYLEKAKADGSRPFVKKIDFVSGYIEEDLEALTDLLDFLVLRGALPSTLVAQLSPEPARASCRKGRCCGRSSRSTSSGGEHFWTRTALCYCPRSGLWCKNT
jgi:hypothetical protein